MIHLFQGRRNLDNNNRLRKSFSLPFTSLDILSSFINQHKALQMTNSTCFIFVFYLNIYMDYEILDLVLYILFILIYMHHWDLSIFNDIFKTQIVFIIVILCHILFLLTFDCVRFAVCINIKMKKRILLCYNSKRNKWYINYQRYLVTLWIELLICILLVMSLTSHL